MGTGSGATTGAAATGSGGGSVMGSAGAGGATPPMRPSPSISTLIAVSTILIAPFIIPGSAGAEGSGSAGATPAMRPSPSMSVFIADSTMLIALVNHPCSASAGGAGAGAGIAGAGAGAPLEMDTGPGADKAASAAFLAFEALISASLEALSDSFAASAFSTLAFLSTSSMSNDDGRGGFESVSGDRKVDVLR